MKQPIFDLHCDLLGQMIHMPSPDPYEKKGIGCSFPALKEGNVKLQVMAIFTPTTKGSTDIALKQSKIFASCLAKHPNDCHLVHDSNSLKNVISASKIGMLAAIENASGFSEEGEPLEAGLKRLEQIIANTTRILYIGFTHHAENRFGGGNNSRSGLKDDGKTLLQYLNGKKIAVDFSHASDALAYDILSYLNKHNLDIPIIASHSNYRSVFNHPRNLPDELAIEIINRRGLIGLNFLRAFVNNDNPNALYEHINHGIELGGIDCICFGADYFGTERHPDRSRVPFYFEEHKNASRYPLILEQICEQVSPNAIENIASTNVFRFINALWN